MITLYLLRNKCNAKVYVGQTCKTLEARWNRGHGYIGSHKIHNAISKYGKKNFYYEVITFCGTQESANSVEHILIEKYDSINNGYNITVGGTSQVMTGRKHSQESIKKMSESHKGSAAHLGMPHSEKTKQTISEKLIKYFSENENPRTGRTFVERYGVEKAARMIRSISEKKKGVRASIATEFKPKISFEIAEQIREERRNAGATHQSIADKYGISAALVTNIINNKRWIKK